MNISPYLRVPSLHTFLSYTQTPNGLAIMCDVKENIFAIKVSLGSANRLSAAKLITGPFLGIISIFASM